MIDHREMGRAVFESLWSAYHRRAGRPRLIFPNLRDGTTRVSEQESKILITRWLESHGYYYSTETPTSEKYTQTGVNPRSARIDVTVYGKRDDSERRLNIELKSRMPKFESFRKDVEKLLREGVPGLWFHTLERANTRTWNTIKQNKLQKSFDSLRKEIAGSQHTIGFVFCVLDPRQFVTFELDFSQDLNKQWPASFVQALQPRSSPASYENRILTSPPPPLP